MWREGVNAALVTSVEEIWCHVFTNTDKLKINKCTIVGLILIGPVDIVRPNKRRMVNEIKRQRDFSVKLIILKNVPFFLNALTFSVVFLSYGCLMSEKNLSRITQKPRNGSLLTLPGGCVSARILGDITRHGFLFLLSLSALTTTTTHRPGVQF